MWDLAFFPFVIFPTFHYNSPMRGEFMTKKEYKKIVRPDAKGRISLGYIAEGVSSYIVTIDSHDRIILEPRVEIPASEKWLFENKKALAQVKRGLQQSADGKVKSRGSFAKYIKDEDCE